MTSLKELFRDPPREYKPMPQWSWNGEITKERITEQLEQFAEQGCGGLFMHARPGCVNGYITDEWFELWAYALEESQRLGIEFQIYDEFTCPGGLAGGNTVAEDPTVIQHELRLADLSEIRKGVDVLCYVKESGDSFAKAEKEDATQAIVLAACEGNGKLPPVDLMQRPATDAFIKTTHDRYRETVGDAFGTDVRFMFCDEPHTFSSSDALPCSRDFMREFYLDHGYRLESRLLDLCLNSSSSTEIRFDFWKTANRLFNENFMKPLHDWCEENKLMFTGHLMENSWPSPRLNPNNMSALRWMQAPGEDLLGFQFDNGEFDRNKLYLLNLKELSSLRNQLGCEWTMVETCGGGGYNLSYPFFKGCEDFTLSFGVNCIDPHLAHATLSGIGKYDWPQTLSDHSPWWRFYKHHAQHVARTNAALSQGQEHNRVLLLMPTTTAWCYYTGGKFDAATGNVAKEKLAVIKESQLDLAFELYQAHVDYDLGDEILLEELGSVEDGKLVMGERQYDVVVIPPAMENLCSSTLNLLKDFAKNGTLLNMAEVSLIDGRKSDTAARLGTRCTAIDEIRKALPPQIEGLPADLITRRVETEEGVLYFFTNPWPKTIEAELTLPGTSIQSLDTSTGEIRPTAFERDGDAVGFKLSLLPRGHELLLVSDDEVEPITVSAPAKTRVDVELASIERIKPNLLYIDYCDVEAYGERREDVNTVHAEEFNWQMQGFAGIPWGKQFRRTIIDRPIKPNTGFSVSYRFRVADDFASPLKIGVERAWLYEITLNGKPLDKGAGERWFDPHFRAIPIQAQPGENVLTLSAKPFHVLCDIMPVYVIGEFSLTPVERGFRIDKVRDLTTGDWSQQGMPFYADVVRYNYSFELAADAENVIVRAGEFQGPVAAVVVDGQEVGPVLHPPYEIVIPGTLTAGKHSVGIDVYGNVKNMMGSHFFTGTPGIWSFQYNPESMPPGSDYNFTPNGLVGEPTVLI